MSNVIVVGGGAAGMMAAISAGMAGHRVWLLEQNEKLGKKIYITGKGRCNFTNACEAADLFAQVVTNDKFLYSAVYQFSSRDVIEFFEESGMKTKVERGGRAFPASDHASDVTAALQRRLKRLDVKICLGKKVTHILEEERRVSGVLTKDGETLQGDAVIIATGGCSYPSTGSTGDGYGFAEELGHRVTPWRPGLVPLTAKEPYVASMQGLSLKNVSLRIFCAQKTIFEDFGELLFTHFGVSGPLVLSASSVIGKALEEAGELSCEIDLKPALSKEQLDARLLRELEENKNRCFKNVFQRLLPLKMIPVVIELSGIPPQQKANGITRGQREALVHLLKHFPLTITGTRGFSEAIITQGGVEVRELNPSTMESKKIRGLFFAGEVLDIDAFTGGYNLQIAWSTGYLAGKSISEERKEDI